ncbi:MAG: phospholipid scramblase-related protein [Polyangiaceae bacterium]
MAAAMLDGDDEYTAWTKAEVRAKNFGRLFFVGVCVAAIVAAYASRGDQAYVPPLAFGLLTAAVGARTVRQAVMGFVGERRRPASAWLALGALALTLVVTLMLVGYFDILAARLEEAQRQKYPGLAYRDREQGTTQAIAALLAAVPGGALFFAFTKKPELSFNSSADADHPIYIVKARLISGALAILLMAVGLFVLDRQFELTGLLPVGLSLAFAYVAWSLVMTRLVRRALNAKASQEEQADIAEMESAMSRAWLTRVGAVVSIGLVFWGGAKALDALSGPQFSPGVAHWLVVVAASIGTGFGVLRVFQPKAAAVAPTFTQGILDDTIRTTGSIELRQKRTLGSILFGSLGRDQYELLDGGSAFCGNAAERSHFLVRLLLGARRPINLVVDDFGHDSLQVKRGFVFLPWLPFMNRADVHDVGRYLGSIQRRFSLSRYYAVQAIDGSERYVLRSGLLFRSRFQILANGAQVGEARRIREPWYVRLFQPYWMRRDRLALTFPQGASLEDKKLLTGSLFLLDITHYPTQSPGLLLVLALALLAALMPAQEQRQTDLSGHSHIERSGDSYPYRY